MTYQMVKQAYLLATTDLFWLSSVACFAMVAVVWLARRPAAQEGPIAAD